jgi:transcriptional regulator with XRE-family HTH domain
VAGSLKALRKERRLTLEAVAVLSDIDPATVSRIERGLVKARRETVVKLAQGLGISARRMRDILFEDRPGTRKSPGGGPRRVNP